MAELRVRMPDEDFETLERWADEEGTTVQGYVMAKLFDRVNIFTAKVAMDRALQRFEHGDRFSVPDCYETSEWAGISKGVAGALGKTFYDMVKYKRPGKIKYVDGGRNGRRAVYEIL